MQFSESWLRAFVNPSLSTQELAHRLTMSGLEVEDIVTLAPCFSGIVVGQVLAVAKHPNADRLSVCQVDAGARAPLNIVCGAPNVAPGIKVPCALIGAQLPPVEANGKPFVIKPVTMRGVDSQGMLCSARELQLSEENSGLMILPSDATVGADLRKVLDLDDKILTLKLTPNRADCLSLFGIAREVAALTATPLTMPTWEPVAVNLAERLNVKVSAPDLCGRFAGRVVRGLNAHAATPQWMKQRLARSGQRSISALVDISNYVMLEFGQPTHVFDLAKIRGDLEVRWGKRGETLELLNGTTVQIDEIVGVIADDYGVASLAGIMGGNATAVSLDTRDIYIEAAFWWPQAIQGRARRYNFSTDAAHRFERGVDYATTTQYLERMTALIVEICGVAGQTFVGPIDDQLINLPQPKPVQVRLERVQKIIGVAVAAEQIAQIFKHLHCLAVRNADTFWVTAPSYRFDLEIEEDFIEEIARCYGYDNIPTRLPMERYTMRAQPESQLTLHTLRQQIAARDYHEVINFSFVEAAWENDFANNTDPIQLLNPIASPMSVMRSSLIGGLIANLRYNLSYKTARIRVFELGKVYRRDAQVIDGPLSVAGYAQPVLLSALAYGPVVDEQWGSATRNVDFYDVKADLEALFAPRRLRFVAAVHPALHPGRCAQAYLGERAIGWLGELHPRWQQKYDLPRAPVLFEIDASLLQHRPLPNYQEVCKYPVVVRDLALVVDKNLEAQSLLDILYQSVQSSALLKDVTIFDQYYGKGLKDNEKSLAVRLYLQDPHGTLNDAAVEQFISHLIATLQEQLQVNLRST